MNRGKGGKGLGRGGAKRHRSAIPDLAPPPPVEVLIVPDAQRHFTPAKQTFAASQRQSNNQPTREKNHTRGTRYFKH